MKSLRRTLYIGLALALTSCAAPHKLMPPESSFNFDYNGKTVYLTAKNMPKEGGDPYNMIISPELGLEAVDFGQDTTIDSILHGNFTFSEVQKIYNSGLRELKKKGMLSEKKWVFTYTSEEGSFVYEIESYTPHEPGETPYNLFFISTRSSSLVKAIDRGGEGTIDKLLESISFSLSRVQADYTRILNRGVKEGKIEKLPWRMFRYNTSEEIIIEYYHAKPTRPMPPTEQ